MAIDEPDFRDVFLDDAQLAVLLAEPPGAAEDAQLPLAMLLHGFPDIPRSWGPVATRLVAAGYRVVAPYLPGYRPSPRPSSLDLFSITDQFLAALDELSPATPVFLVGHDWGAVTSYVLLRRAPERFRAASTLAVPHLRAVIRRGLTNPAQARRSWYMGFFQLAPLADRVVPHDDFAFIDRLWRDWSPGYTADAALLAELRACLSASMPAPLEWYRMHGAMGTASVHPRKSLSLLTGPVTVPTLYLHGRDDGCMGTELLDGQERYFSGGFEQRVVPGAGHFLQLERPDVVADAILAFFGRYGGPTRP